VRKWGHIQRRIEERVGVWNGSGGAARLLMCSAGRGGGPTKILLQYRYINKIIILQQY